ncbi:hypothetical protein C7M84_012248 [Penaeus vannamei]|uniref:Zonadhesin n=1 Tax=Penaeus vannamei TaxID=6689 RepID=A0A3R7M1X8_PENVA|nr:hypothetical protein C7M84_012248 [Penaeus vannamei]
MTAIRACRSPVSSDFQEYSSPSLRLLRFLSDVALDGDVAAAGSGSAEPQGYNYEEPDNQYLPPAKCKLAPVTSVVYNTQLQTSVRLQTVCHQTVPSPPVVQTRFVTSTRVVPQVNYVTRTQVQTQVVPVEVTSTQVRTIIQPLTNYQTQERQATRVVTVPGRDVVQTRVQTVVQTSIVRSQQPAITRFVTSTRVQQLLKTSVVRGQDVVRTTVAQRQQVIPFTSVNTRYENVVATRQQVVTRTNIATQTRILTQVVPQEVVRTQVVPTTIYTTLFETRVQPFTRVQTVVRTQYVTPVPVVQTRQEVRTSVVQVPGQDRVVNREVVQTQQRQQVVMRTLLLSLLVGCAFGASVERPRRQVFGARINLESSYLPPKEEADCKPSVVYRTQVQYSTVVVPSTVYKTNVQYITQTSVRTQQVLTTLYSQIVRTQQVPSVRYQTITVTRTQENLRTQVVTLPPQVNYVTRTQQSVRTQVQYQTRYETRIQQVPTTIVRNVVSTMVPKQVVSTVYRTQTVIRTQQLPDQTRIVPTTQYSTRYSTVVIPAQNVVRTTQLVRTNVVTQTITQPGQTRVITSTQLVPVTTTVISQVVRTNTQIQYVTRTQVEQRVSTVVRTQQVPQYNTRIVTVPQQVVRTQVSTRVVPTTIYAQRTASSYINLPAQTRYVTVTQTSVRTQQLAGQTRTQYNTRIVYNTNYVTSTVYREQYNTVTATQTVKGDCGYSYAAPARAFNPFSG